MTRIEKGAALKKTHNETPFTVIGGSTERGRVERAVSDYADGLHKFLEIHPFMAESIGLEQTDAQLIMDATALEVGRASNYVGDTILELNKRYQDRRSPEFKQLKQEDQELWNNQGHRIVEGVMVCVDQGIPSELYPPDATMGRSLAGNTPKRYIPSQRSFILDPSYLKKLILHEQRHDPPDARVEWLVVHTQCGRVGQMLSNTGSEGSMIPSFSPYFEHADALFSEFIGDSGDPDTIASGLENLKQYWHDHRPDTGNMSITDEGRLAAVLQKIAKRQAIRHEVSHVPTEMPIQLVDKRDLNIYTGLDNIEVLTDQEVIQSGGFTDYMLEKLAGEGRIFSLKHKASEIYNLLNQKGLQKGSRTYAELQTQWLTVQSELKNITANLWQLFESDDPATQPLKAIVEHYLESLGKTNTINISAEIEQSVKRRLIHDLFHVTSYTYLLNTFEMGNAPGHHSEGYLAVGSPEEGALKNLALAQGELDKVTASNILTQHAVLVKSAPLEKGGPIPALLRLDTERASADRMTNEETLRAQTVFEEMLKLWPYLAVGDIVPFLVIRGKKEGGISRLPLSILMTFDNLGICYERGQLPEFVPAANTQGEVVLVPARNIIQTRLKTLKNNQGLKEFRAELALLADMYSYPEVQRSFRS